MSNSITTIESAALKLPRGDRAKIALHLLDSLQQEQSEFSPEDIEKAWIDESSRRLEAYHRGDMKAYAADDVIKELEKSES